MPGAPSGFDYITSSVPRPTPDNVWGMVMFASQEAVAIVRDKRDALANSSGGGTEAYVYPVVDLRRLSDGEQVAEVPLCSFSGDRANWQLYYTTPLQARGSDNGGAPWLVVNWIVRKISPSAFYCRTVTVSWPDGLSEAATVETLDVETSTEKTVPLLPTEFGTLAIAQGHLAWATSTSLGTFVGFAVVGIELT